jgi:hypothetical protein
MPRHQLVNFFRPTLIIDRLTLQKHMAQTSDSQELVLEVVTHFLHGSDGTNTPQP